MKDKLAFPNLPADHWKNLKANPRFQEIIPRRSWSAKHFRDLRTGRSVANFHFGSIHYLPKSKWTKDWQKTRGEDWEEIDTTLVPQADGTFKMEKAPYQAEVSRKLKGLKPIIFKNHEHSLGFMPMGLRWNNEQNQQTIIINGVQDVEGELVYRNRIRYSEALGIGSHIEVLFTGDFMEKAVIIDSLEALGEIPDNAEFLEIGFEWKTQGNIKEKVKGKAWNKVDDISIKEQFEIEQTQDKKTYVRKATARDSNGQSLDITLYLRKRHGQFYIGKKIPVSWLKQAKFPIRTDTTTSFDWGTNWGDIYYQWASTWDGVHNLATGNGIDVSPSTVILADPRYIAGPSYKCGRVYVRVDFSSIPDADPIISGFERIFCYNDVGDSHLQVGTQGDTLELADYDACVVHSPTSCGVRAVTPGWGWYDTALNAAGLANVNKTGWSYWVHRHYHDWVDSAPTGEHYWVMRSPAYTDYEPYFSITYGAQTASSERSAKVIGKDTSNSERSAKLTGGIVVNSERGAKITGRDTSNSERSAKVIGKDTTNSERNGKITGKETANSERSAKIAGKVSVNSERDAKATGKDTTNSERGAKIVGKETANSERNAKLTGKDTTYSDRSAKITGSIYSERGAKVTGKDTANSEKSAKIHGKDTTNSERSATLTGIAGANSERPAKIHGVDTTNSERSAKVTGKLTTNSERNAKVAGKETANSARLAKITGKDAASSERSAKIHGKTTSSSEKDAKIAGKDTTNSGRPAKVTGKDTDISERSSKLTGEETANSEKLAKLTGQDETESIRSAKITGRATASDERQAKIRGELSTSDERSAKTAGKQPTDSQRHSKLQGKDTGASERSAKLIGGIVVNDERDAKIIGGTLSTSERSGKIRGTPLYIDKYTAQSTNYTDKYIPQNTVYSKKY